MGFGIEDLEIAGAGPRRSALVRRLRDRLVPLPHHRDARHCAVRREPIRIPRRLSWRLWAVAQMLVLPAVKGMRFLLASPRLQGPPSPRVSASPPACAAVRWLLLFVHPAALCDRRRGRGVGAGRGGAAERGRGLHRTAAGRAGRRSADRQPADRARGSGCGGPGRGASRPSSRCCATASRPSI